MAQPAPGLKATPLNAAHRKLGARMVDFGGWDMPVQYSSILEEHHAVRKNVGLFDVSHMGEIEIHGPDAFALTDSVTTNAVAKLNIGQAQYTGLLYEHGGFVDDILVHKVSDDHYFICVNASNQEKDFEHIAKANKLNATVDFASDRYAQLAIQGPKGLATLQKLTATDLAPIQYYHFTDGAVSGAPARIARTGYTGEDGFEIYIAPDQAERIWDEILDAGAEFGIKPCGLGARNTLRLESKMALYGHEIHASITPYEADLGVDRQTGQRRFHRQSGSRQTERARRHTQAGRLRDDRPRHRTRRLRSLSGRRRRPAGSPAAVRLPRSRRTSDCAIFHPIEPNSASESRS